MSKGSVIPDLNFKDLNGQKGPASRGRFVAPPEAKSEERLTLESIDCELVVDDPYRGVLDD